MKETLWLGNITLLHQNKTTMRAILTLALFISLSLTSFAQKTAHINTNDLIEHMPEKTLAEEELTKLKIEMESLLQELLTKYAALVSEIEQNGETWSGVILQMKKNELIRLEQAIQDAKIMAEQEFALKEQELIEPILEKALEAIKKVADDKGYDYVIDTSAGNVLVYPENHNILHDVMEELEL